VLEAPLEAPTLLVLPGRTGHRCTGGAHSTVGDGRLVCWQPATSARVAVDAELARTPVPPALGRRWGSTDPVWVWPRWCATECVAKLTDTPIVLLARTGPVGVGPVDTPAGRVSWRVDRVGDLVVVRAMLSPWTP
jgi:hypothetical protein